MVAALIGADRSDIALIASVSAAAGFVAAQFGPAGSGQNLVIGEREYSSNHFPWRMLADKGYEVRQVPFRNGGLEPGDVAGHVDRGTRLVAFSGVQTASGHRSDIPSIGELARSVGALVFVDGSQMVGALPVVDVLEHVDVLATSDHKFLMNAGRGIGYCYLSPDSQDRFTPVNAGWKAGSVPFDSFFGPDHESLLHGVTIRQLDQLARCDRRRSRPLGLRRRSARLRSSSRNNELADLLRSAMAEIGREPIDLPAANRSTIVSVPLGDDDPAELFWRS